MDLEKMIKDVMDKFINNKINQEQFEEKINSIIKEFIGGSEWLS